MRRLPLLLSFFLLTAATAHADLSGVWGGTYTVTTQCASGGSVTSQGSASAILTQSGNSVSGSLSVSNFNAVDTQACSGTPIAAATFAVEGTYDGQMLTLQMDVNGINVGLQGGATDTSMTLSVNAPGTTGSFSLTKTATGTPTDVSGTWSGTYQSVSLCNNNPQMSSGSVTLTATQNGSAISGSLSYVQSLQHCTQVTPATVTTTFTGAVYGAAFSMQFTDPNLGQTAGGGTIVNGLMTVGFTGGDTSIFATLTKTGGGGGPTITSFTATPASVAAGQLSTLEWSTSGATTISINNGIGAVAASGSATVTPTATTTYTLTASNSSGSSTASVTVTVNAPSPANVVIAQFPTGMLQLIGQGGATDHFTLLNAGGSDTDVTLSSTANFFTVSPTSFHLAAGASRVITLTGIAQPTAATYDAAITTGSLAIPVHLLVAAPPQGTVVPQLSGPTRAETVASIGQNQGSGSVNFTNTGTATLYGLAVSDVPWMTPQSGLIIIPPGQTVSISYTIDRTKRADGTSPLGGAKCTLTLRFLTGTGTGAGKWAANDSSTTTSGVSVSLVDVVKPGVAPGTPPPLGNGEVAFFVPGISSKAAGLGDLLLANRGTSSVNDLKMFFGASGGSATQVSSISSIASNAGVTFPGIVRNVFGANDQTGSLQLRSSQIANVSIGTVQSNTISTSTSYQTALPVLRSDRGARSGDAVYLAGVGKSSQQTTNLELQEMSGNAVTVSTDFLDASGNVIASRSDALAPFAFKEVADAVPAGAVTARVKNPAGGNAVVGAYALLFDNVTTDPVVVTDLLTAANASPLIAPLFPTTSASAAQKVAFTNVTSAPVTVTATAVVGANHHRAAPHAFSAAPTSGSSSTFTLPPSGTATFSANGSGYIKLDAPAGALRASAAYATPLPNASGVFGSGVPVLADVLAIANGAAKRFAGVDAASAATVAQGTPGTSRTNLTLVETSGHSATVRVTLRFSFIASSLTSATTTASKDFDVTANGSITLVDVASAVLGLERNSLGDLRGMQLDVSVVSGSGKVLPLVESIDNASGDVTVRND